MAGSRGRREVAVLQAVRKAASGVTTDVSAMVVNLTPELAQMLLDSFGGNRKVSDLYVRRWVADMESDVWHIGPPLLVTQDGQLIDGQHRCHAVIRLGRPVLMLVVVGVDPDVFQYVDIAKVRTGKDTLDIIADRPASGNLIAASLRTLKLYAMLLDGASFSDAATRSRLRNWQVPLWWDAYSDIAEWTNVGRKIKRLCPALSSDSGVVAALYLGARANPQATETFVQRVIEGASLVPGDPALALRNAPAKATALRGANGELRQWMTFNVVGHALVLSASGKQVSRITDARYRDKTPDLGPIAFPAEDSVR